MAFDVLRRLSSCIYFLVIPDDLGTKSRVERLIEQMHSFKARLGTSYTSPIRLVNCTSQNLQHTCLGVEVEDVFYAGPNPSLSFILRFAGDMRRDMGGPLACVFYCESPIALPAFLAASYLLTSGIVSTATEAAGALFSVLPEWAPALFSPSAMHSLSVLESALATFSISTTPRLLTSIIMRPWSGPLPYLQLWSIKEQQKEVLWSGRPETVAGTDAIEFACAIQWCGDLSMRLYNDPPPNANIPTEMLPLFSFQLHNSSFDGDVWRLEADVLGLDVDGRNFVVELRLGPQVRTVTSIPVAAGRNGDELVADGPTTLLPDPTGARVTHESLQAWADLKDAPLTLYYENGTKRSAPVQSITAVGQVSQSGMELSSPQKLSVNLSAPVRCFLSHGRELWIGCADGRLAVVHMEGKQVLGELDAHKSRVSALCSLGGCVWSASADGSICLWTPVAPHSLKKRCTDLQPAGVSFLYTVFGSVWALDSVGNISSWNGEGVMTRKFKLPAAGTCMTRVGEMIWIAVDTNLYEFDGKSGKLETFFKAHDSSISSIAGCEGRLWSASTTDRTLRAWNPKTCECIRIIHGDFEAPLVTIDRCLWAISSALLLLWDAETADLAHLLSISGAKWQVVSEVRKGCIACAAGDRTITTYSLWNAGPTLPVFTSDSTLLLHASARQPLERFACQLRSLLPAAVAHK